MRIEISLRRLIIVGCALATGTIGWITFTRLIEHTAATPRMPRAADEIARVGDVSITAREFREAWARRQPSSNPESARSSLLDNLIRRELLFAEAERNGFTEREDIRTAWRSFIASRFQDELETPHAKPAAITDDEVVTHYREHAEEYSSAERRRLAIIFLPLPAQATPERRAHLANEVLSLHERAIAESTASRDFGALAARHSAHQGSRYSGGDIGWVTRAQAGRAWPPEVVDAAFGLSETGAISDLLPTVEGWYLLKLIDRQPGQPVPLDSVRDRIRYELVRAHTTREEARHFTELRKNHPVQIFTQNLDAVVPTVSYVAQQLPSLPAR